MSSVSPLRLQVGDLPLQGMPLEGEVEFAALNPGDDGWMTFPHPLHFQLMVTPVQQGLLVRGRLQTTVRAACDRCLCAVDIPVVVPDACYHFEEMPVGILDLTESVREDILLALPQACLCREDCRGLCPSCGKDLNKETCSCAGFEDAADPWAGLDRLDLS
jgi:uncharacterized protein